MIKQKPFRSRAYLNYVKSLDSVISGQPADDPHHIIGTKLSGMGTKVSDLWTFPLTRTEHNELHADYKAWEERYGSQVMFALQTIEKAVAEGILR